jgi:prevent-host-death family protein
MNTLPPIVPISDLRYKAKEILRLIKEQPVVLTQRGRPRAVLMDYAAYDALTRQQEALRDEWDAIILQRAQEAPSTYFPLEALVQQHEELFGEKLMLPGDEDKHV